MIQVLTDLVGIGPVAWIIGAVSAVIGIFLYGRRTAKKEVKADDLEKYKEGRQDIDKAPRFDDPDDALEWLSRRAGIDRDKTKR